MAAVTGTLPTRRPRVRDAVTVLAHRAAATLKTAADRLSGGVLTVAGLGCIDVGAFEANTVAGWITTGLSLLLLDYARD